MAEPWYQAPFIGNGELGTMMRVSSPEMILLDVGSSRVHDHRTDDLRNGVVPDSVEVHNRGRLPVGQFELKPAKRIDPRKSTARVHLWNAEATGVWNIPDGGPVRWRALVHAVENVAFFEFRGAPDDLPAIRFVPSEARNPRNLPGSMAKDWKPNPRPETVADDLGGVTRQKLVAGGETVTAWRIVRPEPGVLRLFWTVAHTHPEETAEPVATAALDKAAAASFDDWATPPRLVACLLPAEFSNIR